jgi:hypothetical protein
VAKTFQILELLVEIEPFRPAVEMLTTVGAAHVVVTAVRIHSGFGKTSALTELFENRAGPPVKMRVNDLHRKLPCCLPLEDSS